ncbi:MFS transporter [Humibacter sp.]|jgi:predicted MFS family arabinose efflux permease|uniref:MFS transporter n=1 Tax=Humibacter sp. TaxID=1940291 RepID=UPI002CF421E3|nr:MFS transporter [Humibacter sp.]HVX07367.1 MFS transporter [Humibacter sp.]
MTVVEQSYRGSTVRLLLLALGMFMVGTNAFVIAGLLPRIAHDLESSQASVSYSITLYALIVAVASPAASIGLSHVPRWALMASGSVLFCVGAAIAASSTTLGMFALGRVVAALGGAALVPTATAVAATIVPPERRGRALAIVGAGFTFSVAIGSPLGTELGTLFDWRMPMWCLVAMGVIVAAAIVPLFRGVPHPSPVTLRQRLRPLADARVLVTLGAALFVTTGFNVVYIFSAEVSAGATGGSGGLLAILLLAYGVAGVVGNALAGPFTDRFGSRSIATIALAVQAVALLALAAFAWSFGASVVVFAVWGAVTAAATIPVQHRLVVIEPAQAQQTMAWYSSAMYLGIAIAPPLGNESLALGGPWLVPVTGALVTAIALVLFLAGFRARRMPRPAASGGAPGDADAAGAANADADAAGADADADAAGADADAAGTHGAPLPVAVTTTGVPLPGPHRP